MSQKGTHKKQQTGEATLFSVFYLASYQLTTDICIRHMKCSLDFHI